jgi:NAD+ kinase
MNANTKFFERIAVLAHPKVEAAAIEAQKISVNLRGRGLHALDGSLMDDKLRAGVAAGEFDLVITLGGDGTVLRAGHLCAPYGVPILPVNHGRFGFLIEIEAGDWARYLDGLLVGEYWIEERMMLTAVLYRQGEKINTWDVLNEIVIGRTEQTRPVHIATRLDGRPLTTYVADALILSTPTGSTAYALAAGGPVLPPQAHNFLVVPVAPHLSMDRAIVLAKDTTVGIDILSDWQAMLSADGQPPEQLMSGDIVEVCASKNVVTIVRFQDAGYFYSRIISLMDQHPSAGVVAL